MLGLFRLSFISRLSLSFSSFFSLFLCLLSNSLLTTFASFCGCQLDRLCFRLIIGCLTLLNLRLILISCCLGLLSIFLVLDLVSLSAIIISLRGTIGLNYQPPTLIDSTLSQFPSNEPVQRLSFWPPRYRLRSDHPFFWWQSR